MLQGSDVLLSVASVFNKLEALFDPNCIPDTLPAGKLSDGVGPDDRSSQGRGPLTGRRTKTVVPGLFFSS